MADRIDSIIGRATTGISGTRDAVAHGSRPGQEGLGTLTRRGGDGEIRGKINLKGPFDMDAPRGTYLDILV